MAVVSMSKVRDNQTRNVKITHLHGDAGVSGKIGNLGGRHHRAVSQIAPCPELEWITRSARGHHEVQATLFRVQATVTYEAPI
jgi:hypothetical protein